MKTQIVSKRFLLAIACLTLVQAGPICATAQTAEGSRDAQQAVLSASMATQSAPAGSLSSAEALAAWDASASVQMSGAQLERAFDLGFRVMKDRDLYKAFNDAFASNVVKINARGNGLSLSQMVYILAQIPNSWGQLEDIMKNETQGPTNALKVRDLLLPLIANPAVKASIAAHNDPSRPLRLEAVKGGSGYDSMTMYVDHPRMADPGNPKSKVLPAQDLRQLVIDFIGGAKKEVMFNVFDFDLQPIADAMIAANGKGVQILGGVDASNYAANPLVKAVVDKLNAHNSTGLKVNQVVSVGLNHQKMIVRDAGTPNAAILLLSGNFTQSCIGPEGDAVQIPAAQRPKESVPNANHALMIRGQIPAAVVKQELRKTLVYELKGQSGYPVGGAYQIMGPNSTTGGARSWMILTFSPNGGLGEINRDILTRVIRETKGPVLALHFAFSSDILKNEIIARLKVEADRKRAAGQSAKNLFFSVGDTPFAMQFWSVFLGLSGLQRDQKTGVYSPVADDPMRQIFNASELEDFRSHIRIAPSVYGQSQATYNGQAIKITGKLHHKVFIFPESNVSVVGTSFNPSAAAESNQEQIMVVRDPAITKIARGMFEYLYRNSPRSVVEEAARRNKFPSTDKDDSSEDGAGKEAAH